MEVKDETSGLMKQADIQPFVNFNRLEEVLIILEVSDLYQIQQELQNQRRTLNNEIPSSGPLGFSGLSFGNNTFNELIVAGVKPDLVLIIVILYALFAGPVKGLCGFGLRNLEDLFQAKYFGLNAASKFTIGLLTGFGKKGF